MDGETLYSIGQLARRTGLTVKTIRFYSDRGIVAPTDRNPAGYRLYDLAAVARLALVQTLRDLGFLDAAFGGVPNAPAFAAIGRSMTPELPDNPRSEQVEAWVELAELSQDSGFRARLRRLAEQEAAEQARRGVGGPGRDLIATTRDQVAPALTADVAPTAPEAGRIVAQLSAHYANVVGAPDDAELRRRLVTRLECANDPCRERYLELLAVINDWPAPESLTPVLDWTLQALRARTPTLDGPGGRPVRRVGSAGV